MVILVRILNRVTDKKNSNKQRATEDLLAKVVLDFGGVERPGQLTMAQAISQSISDEKHLIIEAGTGTGKSLGYLVPSAVHAVNAEKGRVVIATATLALQRQLIEKDLPALAQSLKEHEGIELSFSVLKGRNNYVCLQKLHSSLPNDDSDALFDVSRGRLGDQAVSVRAWALQSPTGDRDDYPDDIDPRVWRSFSATRRECIGETKCSFGEECFTALRRTQAASSEIVVTNHAMLAIDAIEGIPILPDHDVVVIDEGHEIVDRVTNSMSVELNTTLIERMASTVGPFVSTQTQELLTDAVFSFDSSLTQICHPGSGPTTLPGIDSTLLLSLTLVRDATHAAVSEMSSLKSEDPDELARMHRIRGSAEEIHDIAGVLVSSNEYTVLWITHDGRPPTLHSAPLDVSGAISGRIFAEKTIVMTSATLSVGSSFDATLRSLGLEGNQSVTTLDVGTPFDYQKQGMLYVATHVEPPNRDGISFEALDEMGELIEAAGGRTLILCSSWRAVERAADYLTVRLLTPLHVQKKGESVGLLVDKFSRDIPSSLIGTMSLWQGVDVPGHTCIQVIIDRIPFPRPDDPITQARSRRIDELGGSGFRSVSVPKAGLLLAQAAGRLIRTTQDRGVVSVLDPRLATAGYSHTLRRSMPSLWFTTSKETTIAALERLRNSSDATTGAGP